jgi:hypothetical protein
VEILVSQEARLVTSRLGVLVMLINAICQEALDTLQALGPKTLHKETIMPKSKKAGATEDILAGCLAGCLSLPLVILTEILKGMTGTTSRKRPNWVRKYYPRMKNTRQSRWYD